MTTNKERAAETIAGVFNKNAPGFPVGTIPDDLAQALDRAGLLVTDLPEIINGEIQWKDPQVPNRSNRPAAGMRKAPADAQLNILSTGMDVYAITDMWWIAAPKSPYAPQILAICGETTATDALRDGIGEDILVGIPADQLDLLIEGLITLRKEAGRAPTGE